VDYNHYSTLRSIEGIFRLAHLGDAAMPQVKPFGRDVYTNYWARSNPPHCLPGS